MFLIKSLIHVEDNNSRSTDSKLRAIKELKEKSKKDGQVIDPQEVDLKKATDPKLRISETTEQDSKSEEAISEEATNDEKIVEDRKEVD